MSEGWSICVAVSNGCTLSHLALLESDATPSRHK